jgi:hypothetical protein
MPFLGLAKIRGTISSRQHSFHIKCIDFIAIQTLHHMTYEVISLFIFTMPANLAALATWFTIKFMIVLKQLLNQRLHQIQSQMHANEKS